MHSPHFSYHHSGSYKKAALAGKVMCGLVLAGQLAACTTTRGYEGPARSENEVAQVIPQGVSFVEVNGIPVGLSSEKVEVPAGKNEITLSINPSNYTVTEVNNRVYRLEMNAEGGKTYAVTGSRGGSPLCAYLMDSKGDPDFTKSAGCITAR